MKFIQDSIKNKLLVLTLGAVISVVLIVALFFTYSFRKSLYEAAESQLVAIREVKTKWLVDYIKRAGDDATFVANLEAVQEHTLELSRSYDAEGAENLRKTYIYNNPNPAGEKNKMLKADNGTEYDYAHAILHQSLNSLVKISGYYDVFIVNMNGDIIYSACKEDEYATNISSGKYANENIGDLFKKLRNAPQVQ